VKTARLQIPAVPPRILGAALAAATFVLGPGCRGGGEDRGAASRAAAQGPIARQTARPKPGAVQECEARMASVIPSALASSASAYFDALPAVILETRITPVLYLAAPRPSADPSARAAHDALVASRSPVPALRALVHDLARDKPRLRDILLSQGYLFAEAPALARALSAELELKDLFDEPVVFLQRGGRIARLARGDPAGAGYADGSGARTKLLVNDRVATDEASLASPLHLGLEDVRLATGAQRVVPRTIGERSAVVDLVMPDGWSARALVALEGTATAVACVAAEPAELARERAKAERFWKRHGEVEAAVESMVEERPGFDEPKDEAEDTQEDGELRQEWAKAYYAGERKFHYRELEYAVFDRRGRAAPPEVCIDFFFDVWERASGNWFRPRGSRPGRTAGYLDFSRLEGLVRRHIPSVLEYATRPGSPLLRYDIPALDQRPLRDREGLARGLARSAGQIREGDALVIHGLREEDEEEHYHAVLVLASDPLTGMPMVVADNSGRPRIRSLASAMASAPRRAVKHRLRLSPEWIEAQEERSRIGK
jgi:hypothetical protein